MSHYLLLFTLIEVCVVEFNQIRSIYKINSSMTNILNKKLTQEKKYRPDIPVNLFSTRPGHHPTVTLPRT